MKAATALNLRQALERDYWEAIQQYLKKEDESSREEAYEVGRRALEEGIGVVELAALYQDSVSQLL